MRTARSRTEREKAAWRRTFDRMIDEHGVDAMERVLYAALDRNRERFTDPKLVAKLAELDDAYGRPS